MNDQFEALRESAVDPFTWDSPSAGLQGREPAGSPFGRELSTTAIEAIAGADWMSCETCWDPGADEPFPEEGG